VLSRFVQRIRAVMSHALERQNTFVRVATRPGPAVVGLLCDLPRSREQLIAENALLRQQLIVAAPRPSVLVRIRVRAKAFPSGQRHRALMPARCQRRSFSGWTMRSAFLHVGAKAVSATNTIRSSRVTFGLATDR